MIKPKSLLTGAGNSIVVRLKLGGRIGILAQITALIAEKGGFVGAIDLVRPLKQGGSIRDFSVYTSSPDHAEEIVSGLRQLSDIELIQSSDRTFLLHSGGKIEVKCRAPLKTREDLSMAYTPGVGRVCRAIYQNPDDVYKLTIKGKTIAVVTDGTAVLGLGDIGPSAALPVMEGKSMLFKEFSGLDAFPICLDTKNTEEIIRTVKAIAPGFGGINLEDISAPRCFEIEERLKQELDIPVFHDDQHGTAVVITAALINALKVVGKSVGQIKTVILGAGAAGTACSKMLARLGVNNIVACDRKGAIERKRTDLNEAKLWFANHTNPNGESGVFDDVIEGADVFIGLSGPDLLSVNQVRKMAKDSIVFALANPVPEILPEKAEPHVAVVATGRSDYPNQINNVLCFPGIFLGALNCQASLINEEMKMACAIAISKCITDEYLATDYIIPSVFDPTVVKKVSQAVLETAIKTGATRRRDKKAFGD